MRLLGLLILSGVLLALTGCGSDEKVKMNTTPLTDEQKKAIAAEDAKIADEESQGSVGKKKGKK
jgi:uncharacterized protein YcfL